MINYAFLDTIKKNILPKTVKIYVNFIQFNHIHN